MINTKNMCLQIARPIKEGNFNVAVTDIKVVSLKNEREAILISVKTLDGKNRGDFLFNTSMASTQDRINELITIAVGDTDESIRFDELLGVECNITVKQNRDFFNVVAINPLEEEAPPKGRKKSKEFLSQTTITDEEIEDVLDEEEDEEELELELEEPVWDEEDEDF